MSCVEDGGNEWGMGRKKAEDVTGRCGDCCGCGVLYTDRCGFTLCSRTSRKLSGVAGLRRVKADLALGGGLGSREGREGGCERSGDGCCGFCCCDGGVLWSSYSCEWEKCWKVGRLGGRFSLSLAVEAGGLS